MEEIRLIEDLSEDKNIEEKAAPETDKKAQTTRVSKHGISIKASGHVTKPSKYSNVADSDFLDPVNYRYPADKAHLRPALVYFNQTEHKSQGGYTDEEWSKMGRKLASKLGKDYTYDANKVKRRDNMSENEKKETLEEETKESEDKKETKEESKEEEPKAKEENENAFEGRSNTDILSLITGALAELSNRMANEEKPKIIFS